jgi:8-hydroxy-5-deazaflavin:NADPH oxidoreductase
MERNQMSTSTSTTIGIIGAGTIGQALGERAIKGGETVPLHKHRGPETLADVGRALGPNVEAVAVAKAADADLVVLAVPFVTVPDVAAAVADWTGRTVVDATNQFATASYQGRADVGPLTGSEWVARHLPGANVIKAFSAMAGAYVAAEPRHAEGRQVVFHAGDDAALNADFAALIETFGFAAVYVGGLADGGRLLQLDGHLSLLHVLRQD